MAGPRFVIMPRSAGDLLFRAVRRTTQLGSAGIIPDHEKPDGLLSS